MRKINLHIYIILFFIAALFVAFCSTSTTPLLETPIAGDSVMFQTIGKYWSKGIIPYIGLWDSKGPIIFFINAFGYFLVESKMGIFVIQIINLFITLIFIFKILKTAFSIKMSLLLAIILLGALNFNYEGGNFTEEYLLPFLTFSLYCFVKSIKDIEKNGTSFVHNYKYAFVYGVCFAFCLLTRVTNAIGLCFGVLIICIYLFVNKQYKNIFYNALWFIVGFMLLFLPFYIYFAYHNLSYEFWYGTILYNIDYAGSSSFRIEPTSINGFITYLGSYALCFVGVLILIINKNKKIRGIMWVVIGTISHAWLLKCMGYNHYAMIVFPYLPIIFIELQQLYESCKQIKLLKKSISVVLICVIGLNLLGGISSFKTNLLTFYYNYYTIPNKHPLEPEQVAIDMYNSIPDNEKYSFVAYNCYTGLYLKLNVCPYYRYFTLQDWASSKSKSLKLRINEVYSKGNAKWILVYDSGDVGIQEILDYRYTCIKVENVPYKEKEYFKLYQLRGI